MIFWNEVNMVRIKRNILVMAAIGWIGLQGAVAESDFEKDRAGILAMVGTFEVSFHFEETVSFLPDYEVKPPYDEEALETVLVIEDSGDRIVLQHLLSTGRGGIIKHWRQDWEYENKVLWDYHGKNTWTKRELSPEEVKGTWTQRVYQVDDSPRYESFGKWEHRGNLTQWTSQRTNRPLPRREHTKRDDYHLLEVINRHAVEPEGWIHEQDNTKVALLDESEGGGEKVIAREFGLNRYRRVDDSNGQAALDWWADKQVFWTEVRGAWSELMEGNDRIVLSKELDGDALREKIADLGRENGSSGPGSEARARVREVIESYMIKG